MSSKINLILVILLLIASFLVGASWNKLGPLSKNTSQASPSPSLQAQVPSQPQVLGAEAQNNLVKGGVVLGNSEAKVTVVEFSDPSCPFCAAAAGADIVVSKDETGKEIRIISDYLKKSDPEWTAPGPQLEKLAKEGKIRLIFRYYPGHGAGETAMQAAWCVEEQNNAKFWEFLNLLFNHQKEIETKEGVLKLVEQTAGIDSEKVKKCLESNKYQERLQSDIQAGREAAQQVAGNGGFGTPTFFINGKQVVGAQSYKVFEQIIQEELSQ